MKDTREREIRYFSNMHIKKNPIEEEFRIDRTRFCLHSNNLVEIPEWSISIKQYPPKEFYNGLEIPSSTIPSSFMNVIKESYIEIYFCNMNFNSAIKKLRIFPNHKK